MKRWSWLSGTAILVLACGGTPAHCENVPTGPPAAASTSAIPSAPLPGGSSDGMVDDSADGWIWSGMVEIDDSQFRGGSAHAGGPGTYAAYTFRGVGVDVYAAVGPCLTVDARAHKTGRANVSIDGNVVATTDVHGVSTSFDNRVQQITGLSDRVHVLQIDPQAGWFDVDYVVVHSARSTSTSTSTSTGAASKPGSVTTDGKDAGKPATLAPSVQNGMYYLSPRCANQQTLQVDVDTRPGDVTGLKLMPPTSQLSTWVVMPLGGDLYRFAPAGDLSQALTLRAPNAGTPVLKAYIDKYMAASNQQLSIVSVGGGYFRISPGVNASVALDVAGQGNTAGTPVVVSLVNSGAGQEWALVPAR